MTLVLAYAIVFFFCLRAVWIHRIKSSVRMIKSEVYAVDDSTWENLINPNESMASDNCERDYGFGLVTRWSASKKVWCSPTVYCYPYYQTGHGGDGDNLCIIKNAMFDPSPFNDTVATRKIMKSCVESNGGAYLQHVKPVIFTSCQRVIGEWKENQLPGWNRDWVVDALCTERQPACAAFDETPTLLIERHGAFANLFHQTEALFNAFLALLIAGLRPARVRVLLADLYPLGPFGPLWKQLFREVRTAWEVKDDAPRCYRTLLVGIYGPASPLSLNDDLAKCPRSTLVRAYARWVWASFRLDPAARPPGAPVRLLWLSRQSRALDPRLAFCDDRYFACADWAHLGVRQLERVLGNEADIVAALRATPALNVSVADFSLLPFATQLRRAAAADVLAGPHGAGLAHLLFLPDGACVFELFDASSAARLHYTNLAAWRGLRYGYVAADPPDPHDVVRRLLDACVAPAAPAPAAPPPGPLPPATEVRR